YHVICRSVEGVDGKEPGSPEPVDRERVFLRVPGNDATVGVEGKAGDLELHVALIGPEPGHLVIVLRLTGEHMRDVTRLRCRILYGFQPDAPARAPVLETHAVTDRIDVWSRTEHVPVHRNAVVDRQAGLGCKCDVGN